VSDITNDLWLKLKLARRPSIACRVVPNLIAEERPVAHYDCSR